MEVLKAPFGVADEIVFAGCGCDIYDNMGQCKYVDDGGCGCDD